MLSMIAYTDTEIFTLQYKHCCFSYDKVFGVYKDAYSFSCKSANKLMLILIKRFF